MRIYRDILAGVGFCVDSINKKGLPIKDKPFKINKLIFINKLIHAVFF